MDRFPLLIACALFACPAAHPQMSAGVGYAQILPQAEFGQVAGSTHGVFMDSFIKIPSVPLFAGGIFTDELAGSSTTYVAISTTASAVAPLRTTSSFYSLLGGLRVQPTRGRVRPYVQGLAGGFGASTNSTLDLGGETSVPGKPRLHSLTTSFGVGGGIDIEIPRSEIPIAVSLGVNYLEASSIRFQAPSTAPKTVEHPSFLMVCIGLRFGFGGSK